MRPEIILIVVCSALIFASVKSLFDRENSNMTIDNFYVRDDSSFVGLLFSLLGIMLGVSIISYFYISENKEVFLIFMSVLMLVTSIIAFINGYNKIIVVDNKIVIHKVFNHKVYDIRDVTKTKTKLGKKDNVISVYVGKKKVFSFSESKTGYKFMCEKLNILDV